MIDTNASPQASASAAGTAFIGMGSALVVLGMVFTHSNPLVACGVAILAVGQVFLVRALRTGA